MSTTVESRTPWWQERQLDLGEGLRLSLGPLELTARRLPDQWQLAHAPTSTYEAEPERWRVETGSDLWPEGEELERYAISADTGLLRCRPTMPDRAVVVRPRIPLFLPPGQEVEIFVSSPVWLRVEVGQRWRRLRELPTKRLSDTWFGGSPREGKLAYAIRTQARMRLAEIPVRPHRAVTPVIIRNRAADTLAVERLNLPVTYLAVYASSVARLWTEAVVMSRDEGDEMASLKVRTGPPDPAGEAQRLTGPRETLKSNVLIRAFSSLLNPFAGDTDE